MFDESSEILIIDKFSSFQIAVVDCHQEIGVNEQRRGRMKTLLLPLFGLPELSN